ncbi:signal peptide containing protein [Theileria equi strain WA]|uniref:Signal peptide containing protein n=1 Tax=Theileria equi strain WA TaxID=1537102 RepID=L1LA74_THEEQ|nr:signal peptide containing protein [Theileria equi strain WA]EKX72159.1 signal peptide containing protein [Theileria equi strain WA]|eukprot:XP_004831611.1 signal peptide containing protein [Theileria equi strain WA]
MRVLALLWTACLLRQCHGGDDEKPSTSGSSPSAPKETPQGATGVSTGAEGPKDSEERSPVGECMNFANPNGPKYKSFEYFYNENHIILSVPNPGVAVTRVKHFRSAVWEAKPGETVEYIKGYLKNGKVLLILVTKRGPYGVSGKWFIKENGAWNECVQVTEAIKCLKTVTAGSVCEIVLDISIMQDCPECTMFDVKIMGLPATFYFPNPGYIVAAITQGEMVIWQSDGYDYCISCDLYSKHGDPLFALLSIRDGRLLYYKYFEKRNGHWIEVDARVFDERRHALMRSEDSGLPSPQEAEKKSKSKMGKKLSGFFSLKKCKKSKSKSSPGAEGASPERPVRTPVTFRRISGKANSGYEEIGDELSGETIDLAVPDPSLYQSFDYFYDNNPVIMVVPVPGRRVVKLVSPEGLLWKSSDNTLLKHLKLYLDKSGKPVLMYVIMKTSYGMPRQYYSKEGDEWKVFNGDYKRAIDNLRIEPESVTNFSMDISVSTDTDQCTVFNTKVYNVNTRFYAPKHGFHAKEVLDDMSLVWESGENGKCLSCDLYNGQNKPPLLLLVAGYQNMTRTLFFVKINGEWRSITEEEFSLRKNEMAS